MNEKEKRKKQIQLLQQNLGSIRIIAGWTSEQLAEKLDVTKQTISNLEKSKTPMSFAQYIAIRTFLDYEIESNPQNTVLPQVIEILIDKGAEFEEEDYTEIKETVEVVAASASSGKKGDILEKILNSQLTPELIGVLTAVGIILGDSKIMAKAAVWIKNIFK